MSNKPYLPFMEFGPVSTQNRNTCGDYNLEQKQNKNNVQWLLNENGSGGKAYTPAFTAGGTVPPSRMSADQLSKNPVEIESWLLNLDQRLGSCQEDRAKFCPKLNYLPTLSFYDRPKQVIMPDPLIIQTNERAFPVPKK